MKRRRRGLYGRLLLWFCIANIGTLLAGVVISEYLARLAYATPPDWSGLASAGDAAYVEGGAAGLRRWLQRQRAGGIDGALFEEGLSVLQEPPPPELVALLPDLLSENGTVMQLHPGVTITVQRVVGRDGVPRQFVALRMPPPPHAHLAALLAVQIALSLAMIVAVAWWLSRGVAQPAQALSGAVRRMAGGDLAARVAARWTAGADELGELARDFNAMAERIERLVDHERGVLRDISHEIRSPLARLQFNLELARQNAGSSAALEQLDRAEREAQRLDRLLGEVLALARLEAGLPGMSRTRIDLAALVRARLAELHNELRGHEWHVHAPAPVFVSGSAPLLERALDNLVGNAVKHGGGAIDIAVTASAAHAAMTVRDHGPGVGAEELAALFRPFFRGAGAAAEGQGLGLSTVERIAFAHAGSVRAENAEGGGLLVRLQLPLAAESVE